MMSDSMAGASREAIEHHYDISNDFYALWLDSTMTYSGALWKEGDSLRDAQIRKIDHHIFAAKAQARTRVLDIGCGWGGVMKRLTTESGVSHAVGLTLSQNQALWIAEMNLSHVEVRVESWADHVPSQCYDAMISIGAFEHFARFTDSDESRLAKYRAFFSWCHQYLAPGGRLSLQTFAYGSRATREKSHSSRATRFLANEIFRETDPPQFDEVVRAANTRFELESASNDRLGYAQTCTEWLRRLRNRADEARSLVGDEVVSRYQKYLQLSIFAFETGQLELWRMTFSRIGD